MKKYEDLMFRDDFMFGKVMEDPELCRKVLERLMQHEVGELTVPMREHEVKFTKDGKSIRLDIYTEDMEANTIYDAEMQNLNKKKIEYYNLPKRSREYQAMIDMDQVLKGENYRRFKDCNVIFICTFDPFGKGLYRYTFEETCVEDKELFLKDGTSKIFYNTTAKAKEIPKDIRYLFDYINDGKPRDQLTDEINEAVDTARNNKEWGSAYMKSVTILDDVREEGREEGLEEGIERFSVYFMETGQAQTIEEARQLARSIVDKQD